MEQVTFFDTIKLVLEEHLHYLSVSVENNIYLETEKSYTIKLFRPYIDTCICQVAIDKKTGELLWLTTGTFGESGAFITSLLEAIEDLKERRSCYVTRN